MWLHESKPIVAHKVRRYRFGVASGLVPDVWIFVRHGCPVLLAQRRAGGAPTERCCEGRERLGWIN